MYIQSFPRRDFIAMFLLKFPAKPIAIFGSLVLPVGAVALRTCVSSVTAILKTWTVQRCSTASAQATEGSTWGVRTRPSQQVWVIGL